MILQLKKGYLDTGYFQDKFSVDILEKWESTWSGYEQEGLLHCSENRIELTRQGLLCADGLLPAFFEEQHQGVRYT